MRAKDAACSTPRVPARALSGSGASDRVLIAGHSQGGQSALFAGELASSYAPELDVLGVAAAAPAADVEKILPLAASINGGAGYLAMGIQGFHAAYPDADPAAVLAPDAEAKSEAATTQCAGEVMSAFQGISGPAVLAHDPLSIPTDPDAAARELGRQPTRGCAGTHRAGQRRHHHPEGAHRRVRHQGVRRPATPSTTACTTAPRTRPSSSPRRTTVVAVAEGPGGRQARAARTCS